MLPFRYYSALGFVFLDFHSYSFHFNWTSEINTCTFLNICDFVHQSELIFFYTFHFWFWQMNTKQQLWWWLYSTNGLNNIVWIAFELLHSSVSAHMAGYFIRRTICEWEKKSVYICIFVLILSWLQKRAHISVDLTCFETVLNGWIELWIGLMTASHKYNLINPMTLCSCLLLNTTSYRIARSVHLPKCRMFCLI